MSVVRTVAALQARHRTVAGIKSAPDKFGQALNRTDLPRALTIPGPGQWQQATMGERKHHKRRYRVQVLCGAVTDAGDAAIQIAIELLQRFGELYLGDDTIVLDADGYQVMIDTGDVRWLRDSGVAVLKYGENEYHGFEFEVGVIEHWDEE